jgi:hypothetical protein
MKAKVLLLFILLTSIADADYGDNLLWRYSFGISDLQFSNSPDAICRDGYQAIFLHTNPYKIGPLNWNYAAGSKGAGRWGVSGSFRSYNLVDLYNDIKISIGGAFQADGHLYLSLETEIEREEFKSIYSYNHVKLIPQAQIKSKSESLSAGFSRICINKSYSSSSRYSMPFLTFSTYISSYSRFSFGYMQLEKTRGRWQICHDLTISEFLSLDLGYLSYPELLQCGLDFGWKKVKFSIIYQGIDKLDDTIIWGISTRK